MTTIARGTMRSSSPWARAILRVGAYELMLMENVPARVAINEYVDVAHAFFGEEKPRFVNGVLDRLARERRPHEFEASA